MLSPLAKASHYRFRSKCSLGQSPATLASFAENLQTSRRTYGNNPPFTTVTRPIEPRLLTRCEAPDSPFAVENPTWRKLQLALADESAVFKLLPALLAGEPVAGPPIERASAARASRRRNTGNDRIGATSQAFQRRREAKQGQMHFNFEEHPLNASGSSLAIEVVRATVMLSLAGYLK
jgi:hypothetical protein